MQVISTNLARWIAWWREDVVCVKGNRSSRRKPTWSSRWRPDLLTYNTGDRIRVALVRSECATRPPLGAYLTEFCRRVTDIWIWALYNSIKSKTFL